MGRAVRFMHSITISSARVSKSPGRFPKLIESLRLSSKLIKFSSE